MGERGGASAPRVLLPARAFRARHAEQPCASGVTGRRSLNRRPTREGPQMSAAREVDIVRPRQHLPWFRAGSTAAQAAPSERGNHFLRPVACTITGTARRREARGFLLPPMHNEQRPLPLKRAGRFRRPHQGSRSALAAFSSAPRSRSNALSPI
ncbi:hypothetical protein HPB50_003830 [Hyalomma asiaticum]|uniref:Uncharacterized protein n=1 Tax=Hyalomma asiaticum TaxID=266040 RepID=A0ACB7TBZ4_HYAAI|nr:hypothetical protein HPB50_003830 [Hyalomma asiaticum]